MSTRHFTEEELQDYVFESEVYEEELDSSRWSKTVYTVFKTEDGKFYGATWEKGLTENQDNEFEAQTLEELTKINRVSVKVKPHYVDSKDNYKEYFIDKEAVEGASIISDGAEEALKAIQEFDPTEVLEFLESAKPALLKNTDAAFIEASRQFFAAIQEMKNSK